MTFLLAILGIGLLFLIATALDKNNSAAKKDTCFKGVSDKDLIKEKEVKRRGLVR